MANTSPAFQFYPDDFIADKNVQAMTTLETGAYIRLMCFAWKEDQVGTLPEDDRLLAGLAKLSFASWIRVKDNVMRGFYMSKTDKRWHQKREEQEYEKQKRLREERKKAGHKGGQASVKQKASKRQAKSSSSSSTSSSLRKNIKKEKYGEYTTLTIVEHKKLVDKYGQSSTEKMIDTLDNYKGAHGKFYKSDYRAILSWVVEKVLGPQEKGETEDQIRERARKCREKEKGSMSCPKERGLGKDHCRYCERSK